MPVQAIGLTDAFIIFVLLGGLVLWIVALIDVIRVPDDSLYRSGNKAAWVLRIVLTGVVGALFYYAIGRPRGRVRGGQSDRDPPQPSVPGS